LGRKRKPGKRNQGQERNKSEHDIRFAQRKEG
jgi:hypothetical protein